MRAQRAREPIPVEDEPEREEAEDLHRPVDDAVEGPHVHVEVREVEVVAQLRVEPVGAEGHREQENRKAIRPQNLINAHGLGLPRRTLHRDHPEAVFADDSAGGNHRQARDGAAEHENGNRNVGAVDNGRGGPAVDMPKICGYNSPFCSLPDMT